MSLTLEELADLIKETSEKLNTAKVFWTLRAYGVKNFREATVQLTQLCLACKKIGVPITSRLMTAMQERTISSVCENLHRLGDQHVLLLKRKSKIRDKSKVISKNMTYEYMVHPAFAKLFNGEAKQ